MSYQLGADPTETDAAVLARLDARTQTILDRLDAQEKRAIRSTLWTIGSVLVALGVIAIPRLRRPRNLGDLTDAKK